MTGSQNTFLSDETVLVDATRPSDKTRPPGDPFQGTPPEAVSGMPENMPGIVTAPPPQIAWFRQCFSALVENVSAVVLGQTMPITQCVTALLAGGHALIEGDPGTGKTQMARSVAYSIAASFKRIQFTPDLLPSDVLGVTFYDQRHAEFTFRQGPVFASIVLADEINRASAKTQSALLEVMEERKVTVDGTSYEVPQPFMVIATQNPNEQAGTYPLPEAQLDRFLMRIAITHPDHATSVAALRQIDVIDRARTIRPVCATDDILRMRQIAAMVHIDEAIREYIVRLVEATRHDERIAGGASMRAILALARCARISAAAEGRAYVVPSDVCDLARAVLAHRLRLTTQAAYEGVGAEELITRILENVPIPQVDEGPVNRPAHRRKGGS
ncbi:ATPase AAA [Bifidobacterium lemurum]|uniref:ATPase AAA n=1 Tax=Bifidobacterium lemurum TaxID=1603886 RepID=A0A261FQA0_9BIFI|nr:MoxR family ATPase [Bifidobacterium lemurum]OZG61268.1 ATPase AAA [Bifidobacterium lemurum]QOL35547.1 MoxR family ATPase [Bifidobacterium lemurum]